MTPMSGQSVDDSQIQRWLATLRDGLESEKLVARERLARVFEQRGLLEEASELLEANYLAGVRTTRLYRAMLQLYAKREHEEGVAWAITQAINSVGAVKVTPDDDIGPHRPGRCAWCGVSLGFLGRFSGKSTCAACATAIRDAGASNFAAYDRYLQEIVEADGGIYGLAVELDLLGKHLRLEPENIAAIHRDHFKTYLDRALDDDYLTPEEDERLWALMTALGFDSEVLGELGDYLPRVFVARANAGRLTEQDDCQLLLKRGEVAYLEWSASLMKEKVVKEWQSGSVGISFRIVKGVRFSTSQTRGRSVVVGTYLAPDDVGQLTVTSRRVVFTGTKRSLEFPYARLMSLDIYSDAVRLHVANRTTAQLFQVRNGYGNMLAATINAAMQQA